MQWFALIEVISSVATALGVGFAALQLLLSKRLAQTQFEDDLTQQYREIIRCIPVRALLSKELDEETWQETFDDIYRYIDLSNEEVFHRLNKRVSRATWKLWQEGIKRHLQRPAFKRAWKSIKEESPNDFTELQMVEEEGFDTDPKKWGNDWMRELTERKKARAESLQAKSEQKLVE